jgi:hypothetical protein
MLLAKHAAFLVTFLVLNGSAQAQFKGVAEPTPSEAAASKVMPVPVEAPNLRVALSANSSASSIALGVPVAPPAAAPETTGTIPDTAPTPTVTGCPDGPVCPPEPEGLGDANKEMLKEFARCDAEGKSLDTCLSDDPPPALRQLTEEDRTQLVQCLGSSDLSATKERWSGCIVGAD